MQATTLKTSQGKRNKPVLNKFLQLLMRRTESDRRIALYGRDPLKVK